VTSSWFFILQLLQDARSNKHQIINYFTRSTYMSPTDFTLQKTTYYHTITPLWAQPNSGGHYADPQM